MLEGMEKLLRARDWSSGCGWLESRGGVLGERYEEGAVQMGRVHRVGTTRDLGQGKEIGGTRKNELSLLFVEMGTSMGSIVAEDLDWKHSEGSGKGMRE